MESNLISILFQSTRRLSTDIEGELEGFEGFCLFHTILVFKVL